MHCWPIEAEVKVQKLSGKRDELLKRVSDCIKSGNHHTFDPSIHDGKWFSAKVLRENAKLQDKSIFSNSALRYLRTIACNLYPCGLVLIQK